MLYLQLFSTGTTEHVADSPYPLRIVSADPYPRKTTIQGPGRSIAIASTTAHFEIHLHDEFGNPCSGVHNVPLETYLESSRGHKIPISMQMNALDGRIMCSYDAPMECGFYRLYVQWGGASLPGTPFSVSVVTEEEYNNSQKSRKHVGETTTATDGMSDEEETFTDEESSENGAGTSGAKRSGPAGKKKASAKEPFVPDKMALWERIAAAAYAADGTTEGWNSDEEERKKKETKEEVYMREHPNVPVVENLEDLWMVSKLQREKKAREEQEKEKKLQGMKEKLEGEFGPGEVPTAEEAEAALKEILQEEAQKKVAEMAISNAPPAIKQENSKGDNFVASLEHPGSAVAVGIRGGISTRAIASKRRTKAELEAAAAALDDLA